MEGMLDTTVAEVRADGITTRYLRAGNGTPVLLLCPTYDARFDALVSRLAASHRVVAPLEAVADDETEGIVARLTAFLDGTGLAPVAVIGVDCAAGPAAALARLHPDRVSRLILLGEPNGTEPEADAMKAAAALRTP